MAKISFRKSNFNVSVPSIFIQRYLPKANGTFVKVYMYALMYSSIPDSSLTVSDIAQAFDIIDSDVYKAWKYWESEGIVKVKTSTFGELDIEFLDLSEIGKNSELMVQNKVIPTKPNYTPKEIGIYTNQNSEIKDLFKVAEQKLGKTLSTNDMIVLFSFYDWLKLPIEVIVMLLEYCSSIDKRNLRYIEKIAIEWADSGIDCLEKAEEVLENIEQQKNIWSTIKKHMGTGNTQITPAELSFFNKWIHQYGFDIEIVKLACDTAVLNTGRGAIKYIDSILEKWYKSNIKTLNEAKAQISNFNSITASSKGKSNNKFLNYNQSKPDFDNLMKLAREKRLKESRPS